MEPSFGVMNTFFIQYTEFGVVPIRHCEKSYFRSNEYSALEDSVKWEWFGRTQIASLTYLVTGQSKVKISWKLNTARRAPYYSIVY